jgi:hypothetical protein
VTITSSGRPATVLLSRIRRVLVAEEKKPTPPAEAKWNDFDLGDTRVHGVATPLEDDRLQLTFGGSGFSGRRRGRGDQFHFRYLAVTGDFEFSCRLLTTEGLALPGRVGLIARENMDALAASAAVACEERIARTTELMGRDQPGDNMSVIGQSERAVLGASWLKLSRSGDKFRGYESIDGADWTPLGEQKIVMGAGNEIFVGLFGCTGGGGGAGGALFDHVELKRTGAGPKALAATPANAYVTPSGSIVSVRSIIMLERGPKVVRHDGTEAHVPTTQIARIVCSPRYGLFVDRIESGKTGLLLTGGDFVEGQVERVGEGNGARLNSVLFGLKHFDVKTQVAAAVLSDVKPAGDWEIRVRDGSVFRAQITECADRGITLREATLGDIKLAGSDVVEMRRVD